MKTELEKKIKKLKNHWTQSQLLVHGIHAFASALKTRIVYRKYCRLSDQWWELRHDFGLRRKVIVDLIEESARATRISYAISKHYEVGTNQGDIFVTAKISETRKRSDYIS